MGSVADGTKHLVTKLKQCLGYNYQKTNSCYQDFNAWARYWSQFRSAEFLTAVSDLHVLMFLATNEILPMRWDIFLQVLIVFSARCAPSNLVWVVFSYSQDVLAVLNFNRAIYWFWKQKEIISGLEIERRRRTPSIIYIDNEDGE